MTRRANSKLLDRYPHGVLTEQEGGLPSNIPDYDEALHVCRLHRIREAVCSEAAPTGDTVRSVPNKPKTPLHSFRCPDELWEAGKAVEGGPRRIVVTLTGDESLGEALRKFMERYAKEA